MGTATPGLRDRFERPFLWLFSAIGALLCAAGVDAALSWSRQPPSANRADPAGYFIASVGLVFALAGAAMARRGTTFGALVAGLLGGAVVGLAPSIVAIEKQWTMGTWAAGQVVLAAAGVAIACASPGFRHRRELARFAPQLAAETEPLPVPDAAARLLAEECQPARRRAGRIGLGCGAVWAVLFASVGLAMADPLAALAGHPNSLQYRLLLPLAGILCGAVVGWFMRVFAAGALLVGQADVLVPRWQQAQAEELARSVGGTVLPSDRGDLLLAPIALSVAARRAELQVTVESFSTPESSGEWLTAELRLRGAPPLAGRLYIRSGHATGTDPELERIETGWRMFDDLFTVLASQPSAARRWLGRRLLEALVRLRQVGVGQAWDDGSRSVSLELDADGVLLSSLGPWRNVRALATFVGHGRRILEALIEPAAALAPAAPQLDDTP